MAADQPERPQAHHARMAPMTSPDTARTLTADAYAGYLALVTSAAQLLLLVPVPDLLSHIHRTEVLGPILDPTEMNRGGFRRLHEQRRMLEAAEQLRATMIELWPEETAAVLARITPHVESPLGNASRE
jgi:hypothetical protein